MKSQTKFNRPKMDQLVYAILAIDKVHIAPQKALDCRPGLGLLNQVSETQACPLTMLFWMWHLMQTTSYQMYITKKMCFEFWTKICICLLFLALGFYPFVKSGWEGITYSLSFKCLSIFICASAWKLYMTFTSYCEGIMII